MKRQDQMWLFGGIALLVLLVVWLTWKNSESYQFNQVIAKLLEDEHRGLVQEITGREFDDALKQGRVMMMRDADEDDDEDDKEDFRFVHPRRRLGHRRGYGWGRWRGACPYGMRGRCPYVKSGGRCPYGCPFARRHHGWRYWVHPRWSPRLRGSWVRYDGDYYWVTA